MNKILIFAGTVEGRKLAEYLDGQGIHIHVCVATEYGEKLLPKGENIESTSKRLDSAEMKELIRKEQIELVIDATHPYAVEVSKNINQATQETNTEYWRVLRADCKTEPDSCIYMTSIAAAAEYLSKMEGNVLLTTGSKELSQYTIVPDYQKRLYARVLSTTSVVEECTRLGFEGKNLICMQGPFSEELNFAMLKQIDAKYLVTKESGNAGGFEEKIKAASQAGVTTIVIGRPVELEGDSYEACIAKLKERFQIVANPKITLLGIGMGNHENMTIEGAKACENADVLIGAKRILDTLVCFQKPFFNAYKPEEIRDYIEQHSGYESIVIALSGDSGFYSGAKNLITTLKDYELEVLPGISSVVSLCASVKLSWEDVKFVSTHGRNENIIAAVKNHTKVFSLLGGKDGVKQLCEKLMEYGLEDVLLTIGEQLSYETETIHQGTPTQLREGIYGELCAALIQNEKAASAVVTHGLADEDFIRGQVPMTKEEVRSISISKMKLTRDSVIYDIGAGTGSVAIEMALQAAEGMVYAIERNPEAIELIEKNRRQLGADNLITITGIAPEVLEVLPIPTHAFIGGSHGNLREILACLFGKNPGIRVVINAITLETIAEAMNCIKELELTEVDIAQVSVSKSKTLGAYHMMLGQNPVYIISFGGV